MAIVDAATEVFAQLGFAGAQMADVAAAAGVSVGTIYNYVEGKEALLLLCAERPFIDITEGRALPVPAPDRGELLGRLEATLARHVRIESLERALEGPCRPDGVDAQLREIVGDLFDLLTATRVGPTRWSAAHARPPIWPSCSTGAYGCGSSPNSRSTSAGPTTRGPLRAPLTPQLAARVRARGRHVVGPSPASRSGATRHRCRAGSQRCDRARDRLARDRARRPVNRCAVAAAIVLVASACSQSAPTPRAESSPTSTRAIPAAAGERAEIRVNAAALGAIADRYRSSCKSPGAAVALRTSDGRDHFALSGRLAPGIALDRGTQFLAGSVTKLFVATVAYQLVAVHRLALGDTVDRYLPGWPRGNQITVAMLLGHRSGMGDFGNDFGKQLTDLVLSDLGRVFSYHDVLDLVRAVPPVAPPGTTYHYSNANYIVLGAILQRVSGSTLGRLIDDRIIEPLRLSRTLYGPDDLVAAARVVFHGLFDVAGTGTPIDIGAFPRNAALTVDPAGAGLFSSLPDLLTFVNALFATNTLLGAASRSALSRSVSTLNAKALLLDGRFAIAGHGGASPGAQTVVAYDRTSATTVAVWCNRLDPGVNELLASVIAARDAFELAVRYGSAAATGAASSPRPARVNRFASSQPIVRITSPPTASRK